MSMHVMWLCWPVQVPSTAKAVLISLADQANDQGLCWPSIAGIADRTCFGRTAVIEAVKWLASAGLLSIEKTDGRTNRYRLNMEQLRLRSALPVRLPDRSDPMPEPAALHEFGPDDLYPVRLPDGFEAAHFPLCAGTRPPSAPVKPSADAKPVRLPDPSATHTRPANGHLPVRQPDPSVSRTRPPDGLTGPANGHPPVRQTDPPVRQPDMNPQEPTKQPSRKKRQMDAIELLSIDQLVDEGVSVEAATEFLALRRRRKAPLTPLAWRGIKDEAAKAGWSLTDALAKCVRRNWQGFEAAWVADEGAAAPARGNVNRQEALEARNAPLATSGCEKGNPVQPADRPNFKTLLSDVMAFYRQDISRFALNVWWQACESFDLEQVTKAFSAHALDPERGQFAPKPADIVRVLHGTQTDRSLIAWGKAYAAMQRVGAYASVCFDDGAIHAVIEDLGGWVKLCRSSVDELPHLQRRFCEAYRAYARRPDLAFPPRLPGAHEQHNALTGKAVSPPVLIGDAAKAQQVLAIGRMTRTQITHIAVALPRLLSSEQTA